MPADLDPLGSAGLASADPDQSRRHSLMMALEVALHVAEQAPEHDPADGGRSATLQAEPLAQLADGLERLTSLERPPARLFAPPETRRGDSVAPSSVLVAAQQHRDTVLRHMTAQARTLQLVSAGPSSQRVVRVVDELDRLGPHDQLS